MRRIDREIKDKSEIETIIKSADVCRVGINAGESPYIVPMNFGFVWDEDFPTFYFHSALEGKKIELIKKCSNVCFEIDTSHELVTTDNVCGWGMRYKSVMGVGKIAFVSDLAEKEMGLNLIMAHYGYEGVPTYDKNIFDKTCVLKLSVSDLSAKSKR